MVFFSPPPQSNQFVRITLFIDSTKVRIVQQMIEERIPNLMKLTFRDVNSMDHSTAKSLHIFKRFFFFCFLNFIVFCWYFHVCGNVVRICRMASFYLILSSEGDAMKLNEDVDLSTSTGGWPLCFTSSCIRIFGWW